MKIASAYFQLQIVKGQALLGKHFWASGPKIWSSGINHASEP